MRTTFERGTKARLSFSGGPHAPVNRADSNVNAGKLDCFWIQRGDGSPKKLQGFAKTWHTKYSTIHRSERAFPTGFFSLLPSFPSSAKIYEKLPFSKSYTILHMRLQLMWIESVLGNLVWPCSLIETSDTELSGIH